MPVNLKFVNPNDYTVEEEITESVINAITQINEAVGRGAPFCVFTKADGKKFSVVTKRVVSIEES